MFHGALRGKRVQASIRCSTPGSRRQLSNCCAKAFGYGNHKLHRGSDEPDAPLLAELEGGAGGEGDLVIGGEQGDHEADWLAMKSRGLDPCLAIETEADARGRAETSSSDHLYATQQGVHTTDGGRGRCGCCCMG